MEELCIKHEATGAAPYADATGGGAVAPIARGNVVSVTTPLLCISGALVIILRHTGPACPRHDGLWETRGPVASTSLPPVWNGVSSSGEVGECFDFTVAMDLCWEDRNQSVRL